MPLRPLTFGELLDAAVNLLRRHGRVFLAAALILALLEQLALYPLRHVAGMSAPFYFPYSDRVGYFWLTFCAGLGTEAAVLALLGTLTGAAAGPALLGREVAGRALLRQAASRVGPALVIAAAAFLLVGVGALALLIPWLFLYGLIGLATPALMIDRLGAFPALGRSFVLSSRMGLRAGWLRIGGYLSWALIRLAMGLSAGYLLYSFVPGAKSWPGIVFTVAWVVVDTIAYAMLACFDAVLYLDTRVRSEGLDIAVARTLRQGRPVELATSLVYGPQR
jgi:cytochrome c oxidase subunit IV